VIEELAPGIWTVSAPLKLVGAELGTRMSIVRLSQGGLVLFAPVEIDAGLASQLAELGPVVGLVAPNAFHHLYFLAAADRYPEARCFMAEGVAKKIGGGPLGATDLSNEPDALWESDLEQVVLEGAPMTNEVIFFHPESRTLVLTDLCFNFDPAPSGWTGFFLRLAGGHGRMAVSRLMRTGLKDRSKVRGTIAKINEWDFDRVIVTHGHSIDSGGKAKFKEATRDL
jgi:hypothetical protein